ncbi:MAG TPA: hypothetical protein VHU40_09090, partial [Polyangia bacterium]|nr:hypothetical protein [Polyangia bacterium]
ADGDGDGKAVPDLGAVEMNPRWQTELLTVADKGPSPYRVVQAPAGLDRGAGTEYVAAAPNEAVTYRLPIVEPARYDLTVGLVATPSGGTFQLAIADAPAGPWTPLGTIQDTFAASPTFQAFGPFPTPIFTSAGEKLLRFTTTSKNAASAGHTLALDYVDVRRSLKACALGPLATGGHHSCVVVAGGVRCWGANQAGQLGDGTTMPASRAPVVPALAGVSGLAAGARHTCALVGSGVRCWGANQAGQLGDGTTTDRATPPTTDALAGAQAIVAGANHTCALTAAGGVRCWGANQAGQLGDGTTMPASRAPVAAAIAGVSGLAAGARHTCALVGSGVRCWGANQAGQLGDGTTTDRATPPTTDALAGAQAIVAGANHTCVLTAAGGVRCWGANAFGQLGDGTTNDRATPPTTDVLSDVASLAAGNAHTCAVTSAGGLRCWGHNGGGELGNGSLLDVPSPPPTDALAGVRQVSAGASFTCARLTSGGLRCWGYNSDGQIGDDTPNATEKTSPGTSDVLTDVVGVALGDAHVCAQTKTGGVRCWGANAFGQLGDGLTPDPAAAPPPSDVLRFAGTCD